MKLSIGSDHGGYALKEALKERLEKWEGFDIIDQGTHSTDSVDYPLYAEKVSHDVISDKCKFGILVCTTGIGACISANKVDGIRAGVVNNQDAAEFSRKHNDANIICFGGKYHTPEQAESFIKTFVETQFEGGRHQRRVDQIKKLEEQ